MKNPLKFLFWPYPKKRLLFQAVVSVAGIRLGLWLIPFKRLNRWLGDPGSSGSLTSDWASIREVAEFVNVASRFVPQATCLTQALATRTLLRRMGQDSLLKIGVDKDANDELIAHAWIEVKGKIIIGKVPEIRRYSVMSGNKGQQLV